MKKSHELRKKLKRHTLWFLKGVGAGLCIAFIISIGEIQTVSMSNPNYVQMVRSV